MVKEKIYILGEMLCDGYKEDLVIFFFIWVLKDNVNLRNL